jgi:hypothetical protein
MSDMSTGGEGPAALAVRTASVRHIAFGAFDDWTERIVRALDRRSTASFIDAKTAPLDAFDAVVPLQAWHYEGLARRPDLRGRKFFHPAPETAALCEDKLRLAEFLAREGFGRHVPALRAPGPPYPYVWKRRSGYFGLHCKVVSGPEDERDLDLADEAWFAQEAVPGDVEYATHVFRADGRIGYVATVTYEMGQSGLVKGALTPPLVNRMVRGCPNLTLFAEILGRLDYEGTACIDYKLEAGEPRLFEINPRVGSSLIWDLNAYLDAYVGALKA